MKRIFLLYLFLVACTPSSHDVEPAMESIDHTQSESPIEISHEDVTQKIDTQEDFVLLDVRELSELEEMGVIEGAVHIPLGAISEESLTEQSIHRDDDIVVYCKGGTRSCKAQEAMTGLGYEHVKSMQGGIMQWIENGKSVVQWISE